ncbi:MAG: hypothetical protein WD906_07110 [Anaerolineales bacterium]
MPASARRKPKARGSKAVRGGKSRPVGPTKSPRQPAGSRDRIPLGQAIASLAERNAELAVLDTVQRGLAYRLGFEAIVNLVGDNVQEVFDAQVVFIGLYDPAAGPMSFPYAFARGERANPPAASPRGFSGVVLKTGATIVVNEDMDRRSAEAGSTLLAGTEW